MKLSSVLTLALTLIVAVASNVHAEDAASSGTGFLAGVGAPMLDGSDGSAAMTTTTTTTTTTNAPAKSSGSMDSMDSMDHSSASKTSGTTTVGNKSNSTSSTLAPSKNSTSAAAPGGMTKHVGVLASAVTIAISAAVALVC